METMNQDVSLRPLEYDDATMIQHYASDTKLAAICNIPHPYPTNGGKMFVQERLMNQETSASYPLAVLTSGELIGVMSLNAIDQKRCSAELAYWIAVPFWERGCATMAVRLVIALAFAGLHLRTLESTCLEKNPAACHVLEKAGFIVDQEIHYARPPSRFAGQALRLFRLRREDWIAQGETHPNNS